LLSADFNQSGFIQPVSFAQESLLTITVMRSFHPSLRDNNGNANRMIFIERYLPVNHLHGVDPE
jgi:hypothetical protein